MPKWTPAQQNAIDARNKNILVSAAAGSGKTAVLVERVIKLITDEFNPVSIDKLLIVTFTNAAAAEMRNRISKSLNELVKENPNNTNALRQLSLLPNANICTIDSFCMNLVKENFFALGISQDFKMLDDSEALLIGETVVNEIIDSLYENDLDEFKSLIDLFSTTKSDSSFAETIKKLYNFIMSQPFPIDWLESVAELYNPNIALDDSIWKEYVNQELKDACSFAIDVINSSLKEICVDDENSNDLIDIVNSDLLIFNNILNSLSDSWDKTKLLIDNVSFKTMTRKNNPAKSIVASNRDLYKSLFKDDIKPLVNASSDEYKEDSKVLYPILKALSNVVKMYSDKMIEMKKEINAFSFSDIEHFAIDLLFYNDNGKIIRTELAKSYSNNFDEILVDEYQDTNTAQDTLFSMLSNGHNLFMVGDVKQSIYRFRLAMPQIFTNKKNSFSRYDANSTDVNQKIILDKNFRSRKGICNYTNFVFSNIMNQKVGELDYNQDEYLNNMAEYKPSGVASPQIKLIETPEDVDKLEFEAAQVAKMILSKIESKEQIKDGDSYRNISFKDFAILFRSTKGVMPVYTKVFNEFGIPVISGNKTNLFENNEISILVSLLRTIDNPTLDIPLLATLMSVFYGYSVDEISYARATYKSNNLYSSIIEDYEHFNNFIDDINRYRDYASTMSVETFIRQIINETSFMSIVSAMGNSDQRRQNIYKFLSIAKSYDSGNSVGLTSFIRYIDSIISSKLNVESAEINNSSENCVSFMSIHKSKGLEFPVCILANADHKYNMTDLNNQVQLNDKYGIGLKVHNESGFYRYNSLQYVLINDMNRFAMMSENLRVLYVAITRAKEQFISIISLDDVEKHVNKLSRKIVDKRINPYVSKHIQCDADFILLTALLHKDGVELRNLCEGYFTPLLDDFDLNIEFLNKEITSNIESEIETPPDLDLVKQIENKLLFNYDRFELSGFISKRNASSLDEQINNYSNIAKSKPAFLQDGNLTPAQKGTAMHTFMQFCNYDNAIDDLNSEIDRLVNDGYLSTEYAITLNKQKLNNLFSSELMSRMKHSSNLYREIKLSSFVPVCELEKTIFDDKVLVQGIADCVFEENGELVLVDYKTDKVDSELELLDRYKNQISFYKNALSKTFNKPVKQAMLYSFSLDKCCIYK